MNLFKKSKSGAISLSTILLVVLMAICLTSCTVAFSNINKNNNTTIIGGTIKMDSTNTYVTDYGGINNVVNNYANKYVVVRNQADLGSHYAYNEGVSDDLNGYYPQYGESNFNSGSRLDIITLNPDGTTASTETLYNGDDVIRDVDVSYDGLRLLYSKKSAENGGRNDDYHLYEYNLTTKQERQLTFGQGVADIEGKYLPNGNILFSSTRASQTVDCWRPPVSNIFLCDADGENIIRLGYDQVHTTYPTVDDNGRVIYTRWDYNDRTQMYVQGVFQMNLDGTNQTELYGNNVNAPTTLLHTVKAPGYGSKYFTIVAGHHNYQRGKLAVLDTAMGNNNPDSVNAISFFNNSAIQNNINEGISLDNTNSTGGTLFRFPYAISETELFYSRTQRTDFKYSGDDGAADSNPNATGRYGQDVDFNIYYYNIETGTEVLICDGSSSLPCSQIVPIRAREGFTRSTVANYGKERGTYYIANVYEGDGLKDIALGEAKYLRVVALEYRPYALGWNDNAGKTFYDNENYKNPDGTYKEVYYVGGSPYTPVGSAYTTWDIKAVLGIVDIYEDGSALFEVPSNTPLYFQVLNERGEMIQTMRSWSTLMGGETYSCVGCHENRTQAPTINGKVTKAMKAGVQQIQKEMWMTGEKYENYDPYTDFDGFSYTEQIQQILDESCVSCHNNVDKAVDRTQATVSEAPSYDLTQLFPRGSAWHYKLGGTANNVNDTDGWTSAFVGGTQNPNWTNNTILFKREFSLTQSQADKALYVKWTYDENPTIFINGYSVLTKSGYTETVQTVKLNITSGMLKEGTNTIVVLMSNYEGGYGFNLGLYSSSEVITTKETVLDFGATWNYKITDSVLTDGWQNPSYSVSSWSSAKAGIGSVGDAKLPSKGATSLTWLLKYFNARTTFNLTAEQLDKQFYLYWQYDESPRVFINGTLVTSKEDYVSTPIYTKLLLPQGLLVEGQNVIAVELENRFGGAYFDLAIQYDNGGDTNGYVPNLEYVFNLSSQWNFATDGAVSVTKDTDGNPINFVGDSGWWYRYGAFGLWDLENGKSTVNWQTSWITAGFRKTFTLTADQLNKDFWIYWMYDENPIVYINGVLVYKAEGFLTKLIYTDLVIPSGVLKEGENVIAVYMENTGGGDNGGEYFDLALGYVKDDNIKQGMAFSLQDFNVHGYEEKFYYTLSYLVLTGSTSRGGFYSGNSMNNITNWVSAISQCEMLRPYQYGSSQSGIIKMLRGEGVHQKIELTEAQIRAICCWIDIGCPFRGEYDERVTWNYNEMRLAESLQNKQDFYAQIDNVVKKTISGLASNDSVKVTYNNSESATNKSYVQLYVGQYNLNDTIKIEVPTSVKYIYVNIHSRVKTQLVRVENGVVNITFVTNMWDTMGEYVKNYKHNTITVWIPLESELDSQINLAQNIFFDGLATGVTATSNSEWGSGADNDYIAGNAIDGQCTNVEHTSYPNQSWGAKQEFGPDANNNCADTYITIDFGMQVDLSSLIIYVRSDNNNDNIAGLYENAKDHDSYAIQVTVVTSDGKEYVFPMYKTENGGGQILEFEEIVTTSSITLKDFVIPAEQENQVSFKFFGISEIEAIGKVK